MSSLKNRAHDKRFALRAPAHNRATNCLRVVTDSRVHGRFYVDMTSEAWQALPAAGAAIQGWTVVAHPFNLAWYPDLVGRKGNEGPPSYAVVQLDGESSNAMIQRSGPLVSTEVR